MRRLSFLAKTEVSGRMRHGRLTYFDAYGSDATGSDDPAATIREWRGVSLATLSQCTDSGMRIAPMGYW